MIAASRHHIAVDATDTGVDPQLLRKILDAATPLFVSQGLTGTTADQIAKACGISKKTLYKCFPTKESLLRYGIDVLFTSIKADNDLIMAQTDLPPRQRISGIMERTTGVFVTVATPTLIGDIRRSAPAVWDYIMAWRTAHVERFMTLLDECLEQNELRDGLSIEDIRAVFQLTLLQATEYLVAGDARVSSPDVYKGFLDTFFHGIMVKHAQEAES